MAASPNGSGSVKSIPVIYPAVPVDQAQLQARIQGGALKSGDKLPSERRHARSSTPRAFTLSAKSGAAGVSGLIYGASGRGWFVTPERLWLDRPRTPAASFVASRGGSQKNRAALSVTVPVEVMPLQLQPF